MIIHSYATDGYHKFAKSLLLSFKEQHGEEIPFVMHTKDMSQFQLDQLNSLYGNLTLKNSFTDWDWLEKNSGLKLDNLKMGKQQVEQLGNRYLSKQFYHWKHYISIYSRYRDALKEMLEETEDGEHILHLDIDLYINNKIDVIFNTVRSADVSILLRPEYSPEWRKVYGCILGFTVNDNSRKFMTRVRRHIMAPKFKDIEKGYGQTVFWRAYNDFKDSNIRIAAIPKTWIHKGFNNRALILSANNGLRKQDTAEKYRQLTNNEQVDEVPPRGRSRMPSKRQLRKPKPRRGVQEKEVKRPAPIKRSRPIKRKPGVVKAGPKRRVGRRKQ